MTTDTTSHSPPRSLKSSIHGTRSRRRLGFGKRILFLAATLLVALLVAELGLRVYAYSIGRGFLDNPRMFTSPFFTHNSTLQPEIVDDTFSFHGKVIPRQKQSGEIRIICFGGSTTENPGIVDNYPDQIERKLSQSFPSNKITVLNAGRCGYSSAHSLVNLSLRCLDCSPDIVLVYHNINDLSVNYFGNQVQPDYSNKYLSPYYLSYHHRTGFLAELSKISRLARVVETKVLNIRHAKNFRPEKSRADYIDGLPYLEHNFRSIVGVAKANEVRVVLATQAARTTLRSQEGFSAYNARIQKVAESLRVPCVDVASKVTSDELFADSVHCTQEGVDAVADALFSVLFEQTKQIVEMQKGTDPVELPHLSQNRN